MAVPTRELTVDGYERQFATNYLGPFALTALLFWSIKPQPGSRIVTVASGVSNHGKIEFDNLNSQRRYSPMWQAYAQSKLADLIFQQELQRRLTAMHSPILSTGAHPGYAVTNLQVTGPGDTVPSSCACGMIILKPLASQDAAHGALPTLFAATAPEATPGGYYGPSGFQELKGYPVPAKITAAAKDVALAQRLWTESERLTGVRFEPLPRYPIQRAAVSLPDRSSQRRIVVGSMMRLSAICMTLCSFLERSTLGEDGAANAPTRSEFGIRHPCAHRVRTAAHTN